MTPRERERLTSSFSLQQMNVTVYTLEAMKTVFVELFCTPKSSMENPSLRVRGHGGKMSVDNGLLTKQLVSKVLMMKDRVFGHGTTTSMLGSPESFRIAKLQEEKAKEKAKARVDLKSTGKAYLGEKNKHKILNGGQKKTVLSGPRVKRQERLFER